MKGVVQAQISHLKDVSLQQHVTPLFSFLFYQWPSSLPGGFGDPSLWLSAYQSIPFAAGGDFGSLRDRHVSSRPQIDKNHQKGM